MSSAASNQDISGQVVATVDLSAADELERSWIFEYLDGFGRPTSGVLIRLNTSADEPGEYRAYRNLCPHWSMPLDAGSGEFFDESDYYLHCKMHGARFEPATGECIMGPCDGDYLQELGVELSADGGQATIRRSPGLKLGAR